MNGITGVYWVTQLLVTVFAPVAKTAVVGTGAGVISPPPKPFCHTSKVTVFPAQLLFPVTLRLTVFPTVVVATDQDADAKLQGTPVGVGVGVLVGVTLTILVGVGVGVLVGVIVGVEIGVVGVGVEVVLVGVGVTAGMLVDSIFTATSSLKFETATVIVPAVGVWLMVEVIAPV